MNKEKGKELIDIKNKIQKNFNKSDWLELGFALGTLDIVNGHDRLLRSLSYSDDDYEGNILDVLNQIIERDKGNLDELKSFVSGKYDKPKDGEFISTAHTEQPTRMVTFSPHVFTIPKKTQNKNLVSVMLPFKYLTTFEAIKLACDRLHLECKKANDIWENSTFIQDIFDLIFISQIVVADFSGKNANVFYEVGIAHALGMIVVPITQSLDDVPSDLQHHRILKYLPNTEGYKELSDELVKIFKTLASAELLY